MKSAPKFLPEATPDEFADETQTSDTCFRVREPMFSIKAHRRIAEIMLGRKTVDEMFDEMAREREQGKPQ